MKMRMNKIIQQFFTFRTSHELAYAHS